MSRKAQSSAVGCMLTAAGLKERLASIKELNAAVLHGYRRVGSRVELSYAPSAAARLRELVEREQECCPLLDFTIRGGENGRDGTDHTDALTLVIEAPEGAGEAADALFASYARRRW